MGKNYLKRYIAVLLIMLLVSSVHSIGIGTYDTEIKSQPSETSTSTYGTHSVPYTGRLRLYIVEPQSRWDDDDRDPFHFGFLDFALDENLSIQYLDTYAKTVAWSARDAGFYNVKENNVIVIAAVFNSESQKNYANPPTRNPFDAYYTDATAGAKPGDVGTNNVTENFTHTVFIEEAVATWCQYCPITSEKIFDLYETEAYPFYFVSLIADVKIPSVEMRLNEEYNLNAFPTTFFDGGYRVLVGGYDDESYYETRIEQCGKRDVHTLNLSLAVTWLGNGNLSMDVAITNNEEIFNSAPNAPMVVGPSKGKPDQGYEYTVSTVDPEGDDVFYLIDWGDDSNEERIGPFLSGEEVKISHTWSERDMYLIQVKARDIYDAESDWATLEVRMVKEHPFNLMQTIHAHPGLITPLERIRKLVDKSSTSTESTKYWGLLIAVGEYLNNPDQNRPSMLTQIDNIYGALIRDPQWEATHILRIKGENANLDNILNGFNWLLEMEGKNDISLIYITTHGYYLNVDLPPFDEADGKDEILIPYEGFDDTSKFVWDDEIDFVCRMLQSKGVCLIVDSCFSGGFNDAHIQVRGRMNAHQWMTEILNDLQMGSGRVILMSCKENEVSYGSTFSYYISRGMYGEADENTDHVISAEELFRHAEPYVTQYGAQHPTLVDTFPGELPVTQVEP